jgi:hypothetical protein
VAAPIGIVLPFVPVLVVLSAARLAAPIGLLAGLLLTALAALLSSLPAALRSLTARVALAADALLTAGLLSAAPLALIVRTLVVLPAIGITLHIAVGHEYLLFSGAAW